MNEIEKNLSLINQEIEKTCQIYGRKTDEVNLVAVSKKFPSDKIIEAINANCKIFGENYINEAYEKWPEIRQKFPFVKLHFIGKLQSNKADKAVDLFDVIESLDSEKLAREIKKQCVKKSKNPEIYVQVNIGQEPQKSGIDPLQVADFIDFAKNECELNVVGLMAIPPSGEAASLYFGLLKKLANENGLAKLSMGMSADYKDAIAIGATSIRVGEAIFGKRK